MANTQTTVPLFVANQVLTAAQQNTSAGTGVPVFATTVTRDAAFGGSNKALAKGQLCYLEATSLVQQYNGSAWVSVGESKVVQTVNTQTGAVATGTTTIPFDNTIPQNTEGTQVLSLAITPTSASNLLIVSVVLNFSYSIVNTVSFALFQDSTANALAAAAEYGSTATGMINSGLAYKMTAGTTSATTFKVRIGGESAGTVTLNGFSGGQIFGGVMTSSMTITEYTV
jgi:hypothetical protein